MSWPWVALLAIGSAMGGAVIATVVFGALVAASKDDDRTGRDIWR